MAPGARSKFGVPHLRHCWDFSAPHTQWFGARRIVPLCHPFVAPLRADIAYRYCNIKSHNEKSRCRQSLQYEFVTSHSHFLRLHAFLHPCFHDASGQRDSAELITAGRLQFFSVKHTDRIYQGWPNFGFRAACGSLSFPKYHIFVLYFLFLLWSVEIF